MLVALCRKPRTMHGLRYHFRMNDLAGSPAMSTEGLGLYALFAFGVCYAGYGLFRATRRGFADVL